MPSSTSKLSAFPPELQKDILSVHNDTYFGAQYRAYALDPVRLRTPVTGFALGLLC